MYKMTTEVIGYLKENCYLLSGDTGALVIDPGKVTPAILAFCEENRGKEGAILITHAHFDHILGVAELKERFHLPVMIGIKDAPGLNDPRLNLCTKMHQHEQPVTADRVLSDGETFFIGDLPIRVIETPGHTPGGVCYRIEDRLFSGDTLFAGCFGRTDFFGGDAPTLYASLDRLLKTEPDCAVFPGHGEPTTLAIEREKNPYKRYVTP